MRELTPAHALALADIDARRAFALVLADPGPPGQARIHAVARVSIDEPTREAEFAIVLVGELAGHGLGTYMLRKLIQWCRRKRLTALYGNVLSDNHGMLTVADHLGFRRTTMPQEPGLLRVHLPLTDPR
jgi:RimJ/RimL family protein N-acetyltransferase